MTRPQTGSVMIITGTSSGIGRALAVQAAVAGFEVVATMRDVTRDSSLRALAAEHGVQVDIRTLDVSNQATIRPLVDAVVADYGRLDVLVNNAAAGRLGTIEVDGTDAVRAIMESNFFGTVGAIEAAMPHLRETGGRIVTVTSEGGIVAGAFNESYCASKFALEGFMEALAPLAATVGVTAVLVEPGPVETEFYDNLGIDLAPMVERAGPYGPQLEAYVGHLFERLHAGGAQTSAEAAAEILAVVQHPDPPLRTQTSDLARNNIATKLKDLDGRALVERGGAWLR